MADRKSPKISEKLQMLVKASQERSTKVTLSAGVKAPREKLPKPPPKVERVVPSQKMVFSRPVLKDIELPPIYRGFVEKLTLPLRLTSTGWQVLDAFSSVEVTASRLAGIISANPYLEHQFRLILDRKRGKQAEVESLESAVVLLGMQNSRNHLLTIQLQRLLRRVHSIETDPASTLRYALQSEEKYSEIQENHSDIAFGAGLLFDVLVLCADRYLEDDESRRASVLAYLKTVYEHGFISGRIAINIARQFPEFGFSKYIFSAAMIHDVGKVAMAILDPDYPEFSEQAETLGLPRSVRHFVEQRQFGTDHAQVGAWICREFRIFNSIEPAVGSHHEPFLLKSRSPELHQLSALVSLASNIARQPKRAVGLDDPIIAAWKGPELGDFKVDPQIMMEAAIAALT